MPSFSSAKRNLGQIYFELNERLGEASTLYCGCPIWFDTNRKWHFDTTECGYKIRKSVKRATRIEVEHVMPAWEFGNQMDCWKEGGRKACSKDKVFKEMEGDLHNLYPSVGEVNGDRKNFKFSELGVESGMYGKCEMVIDFKSQSAQPPKHSRGIIARAYLYMAKNYGIVLSESQLNQFQEWDSKYAPDEFECSRNEFIKEIQGNDNAYITAKCPKSR